MAGFKRTRGWRRRGPGIKAGRPESAGVEWEVIRVAWPGGTAGGWRVPRRRVNQTADPAGGGGGRTEARKSYNRSFIVVPVGQLDFLVRSSLSFEKDPAFGFF